MMHLFQKWSFLWAKAGALAIYRWVVSQYLCIALSVVFTSAGLIEVIAVIFNLYFCLDFYIFCADMHVLFSHVVQAKKPKEELITFQNETETRLAIVKIQVVNGERHMVITSTESIVNDTKIPIEV
jgi:hypothetical protein